MKLSATECSQGGPNGPEIGRAAEIQSGGGPNSTSLAIASDNVVPTTPEECLERYSALARKLATRYGARGAAVGLETEDLYQEAKMELLEALRDFDPSKGSFPAWVSRKVRWRLADLVKEPTVSVISGSTPRLDDEGDTGDNLLDLQPSPPEDDGSTDGEREARLKHLRALLGRARLTPVEARVLTLRWGLDRGMRPRPRAQVVEKLESESPPRQRGRKVGAGVKYTRETVRLTELTALRKLRCLLIVPSR